MAKYEVFKDGKKWLSTDYEECFYPPEIAQSLIKAGYKIYIDGKIYKLPKTKNVENSKNLWYNIRIKLKFDFSLYLWYNVNIK